MIMNFRPWEVTVFIYLSDETIAVPAGKLTVLEEGAQVRAATFGYGRIYLGRSKAIPLDPLSLPLIGAQPGNERVYEPCNGLEQLFARMVFNILVGNDDDHLRNHAFIWVDNVRGWKLSPLYDVLPKPQMGHERYLHLGVGEQGRRATLDNALSHAGQFGLLPAQALSIVDRMARQVREWRVFLRDKWASRG